MKIDNSTKPLIAPASGTTKSRPKPESAATATAAEDVKLSPLAGQFQPGEAAPPFDSARVQEIKQAIAEGRFAINAGAIADRLLDSARDLIGSQRRA